MKKEPSTVKTWFLIGLGMSELGELNVKRESDVFLDIKDLRECLSVFFISNRKGTSCSTMLRRGRVNFIKGLAKCQSNIFWKRQRIN